MPRKLLFILLLLMPLCSLCALDIPRWGDAYWRDSVPATMRQSYIRFGERYLGQPWNSLSASVFAEFKKTGNHTRYEGLMFENRRQLAALVMAEVMEGRGRFMPDVVSGLMSTLEETWWGLPAHYKTELPRPEDQNVDLFNAETASLVAWTRYVLSDEIDRFSPLLSKRIDAEVARRILQPAVKTKYWWKTASMNWNPWICSNWMACVCFCEHDEARRQEAVSQILKACEAFMDAYPADGGCDEGPHYWDRAAASLFETMFLLQGLHATAQGSQPTPYSPQLSMDSDKLRAMESYIYKMYIGNGYAVNFADAHGNRAMLNVNIAYPFGRVTGDVAMRQYAAYAGAQDSILVHPARLYDKSGNWPSLGRELIFLRYLGDFLRETPREPSLPHVWLPDLQIMTARTARLFVAMKGGTNGESHNHNDVGSFIVYADGEPLLIDPGVGEYTAKTFSKQRYEIWTMQSDYHNLPRINGCSQRDGKQYAARLKDYKPGRLTLDLAGAYPEEAHATHWERTVQMHAGSRRVDITERYELSAVSGPTELVLMTPLRPDLSQKGTVLLGSRRLCYDSRLLDVRVEDVSGLMDPVLRQMWGTGLHRIVMTVRTPRLKNTLKYTIQ